MIDESSTVSIAALFEMRKASISAFKDWVREVRYMTARVPYSKVPGSRPVVMVSATDVDAVQCMLLVGATKRESLWELASRCSTGPSRQVATECRRDSVDVVCTSVSVGT